MHDIIAKHQLYDFRILPKCTEWVKCHPYFPPPAFSRTLKEKKANHPVTVKIVCH